MYIREAKEIFWNIYNSSATDTEKIEAIESVVKNTTQIKDITKQEYINVLDWLLSKYLQGKLTITSTREFLKAENEMCKFYNAKATSICDCRSLGCSIALKYDTCSVSDKSDEIIEDIIAIVSEWNRPDSVIKLTEQQKIALKGRVAEGAEWVFTDNTTTPITGRVYFSDIKPEKHGDKMSFNGKNLKYYSICDASFYNFVTWENSPICIPDLLKGEEED